MMIEADVAGLLAVAVLSVAADRDQERVASVRHAAKPPGDFKTVELGKAEIEYHHLRTKRPGFFHGSQAVVRGTHVVLFQSQQQGDRIGRVHVVVDYQNAIWTVCGIGVAAGGIFSLRLRRLGSFITRGWAVCWNTW